jgi:hypothetical protein
MSEPYWAALGGGSVDYKGAWAAGTAYAAGDVVRHNGVDYLAVNPSTGVDPGVATGIPQPDLVKLFDETLTAVGAFTIPVPAGYAHLRGVGLLRGDGSSAGIVVGVQINGDTGNNYFWQNFVVAGSGLSAGTATEAVVTAQNHIRAGRCLGASAPAGSFASITFDIPHHTNAIAHKVLHGQSVAREALAASGVPLEIAGGYWTGTSPLTALRVFPTTGTGFVVGSRFSLYGLRA